MDTSLISDCNHETNGVTTISEPNNDISSFMKEKCFTADANDLMDAHHKDDGDLSEEGEIDEEFEELSNEPEVKEYKQVVRSIGVHLRCTCCGKVYSDPVTLKCGHPIDRDCAAMKLQFNQITCPMCRKRDRVASVDDLVTDFDLASQIPPKPRCWFERKQNINTTHSTVNIIRSSPAYSDDDYENDVEDDYYEEKRSSKSKKKSKKKKKNRNKKQFEDYEPNDNNNGGMPPGKRPCLSQPQLPQGFDASVPPPGFLPPMSQAPACSVPASNPISWLPTPPPPNPPCQPVNIPNPPPVCSSTAQQSTRPLSSLERQQLALQGEQHKPVDIPSPLPAPPRAPALHRPLSTQPSLISTPPILSSEPNTPSSTGTSHSNFTGGFANQSLLQTPTVSYNSASTPNCTAVPVSQSNTLAPTNEMEKVNELHNHAYELYQKTLSTGYGNSDLMSGPEYMQFYQQMMSSAPQNIMMNSMYSSFNQWQQYFQQYMQQYMQQFFHQYTAQAPASVTAASPSSTMPVGHLESHNSNPSIAGGFQSTTTPTTPSNNTLVLNKVHSEQEKTKYLWICNLPEVIKAKDIKLLCLPHGRATNIKIATSKKVTPKMIMAYVTMDSVESAEKVFNTLDANNLQGSTLKVKYIKTNPFESTNHQN